MKNVGYLAVAYTLVNLALFGTYWTLEPPKTQRSSNPEIVLGIISIVFPIIFYFASLYFIAKKEIEKGTPHGRVVKYGYIYAIGINLGFVFPWFIFGIGPNGRITFITIEDIIGYIISMIIGCVLMGGLLGLLGMMMLNNSFGDRTERAETPNQAL